jgi:hypothetical protein
MNMPSRAELVTSLFGTYTKRLKEQMRRNIKRFPTDFMFELNQKEEAALRTQFEDEHAVDGVRAVWSRAVVGNQPATMNTPNHFKKKEFPQAGFRKLNK